MNDNSAAGLQYGMFRTKEFNETATTLLIYDMGATKTTATIVEYQVLLLAEQNIVLALMYIYLSMFRL